MIWRPGRAALGLLVACAVIALAMPSGAVAQDQTADPDVVPVSASAVGLRLEAAFPDTIVGQPLETISYSGEAVVAGADDDDPVTELAEIVEAHGATLAEFAIASGSVDDGDAFVGLLAATIEGVPATEVADDLTRLILELDPDAVLSDEVIGGRELTQVSSGSGLIGDAVAYVLSSGEIVWYVVAESPELEEVIEALP